MAYNTNDIFNNELSLQYDACNGRLGEIIDNMHMLISLLLNNLPEQAKILCVGVGTGTEIIRLARFHPQWHFTGIDPSPDMLAVCSEKLTAAGLTDRCQLNLGYLSNLPVTADYDAVLCLLVTHFIQHPQRDGIYTQMYRQLKTGGRVITAEIAGDIHSPLFNEHLEVWRVMHETVSQKPQEATAIMAMLTQRLLLLPPEQTETLIEQAGFSPAQRFFQSLLIHGWTARKVA